MAKMISIGTANQDVYLTGAIFQPECEAGVCYEHLKLGEKLYADKAYFATGGNTGNAAVTFSRQGHDSQFIGVVGNDPAGKAVVDDFKKENVDTSLLAVVDGFDTSYSVVLLAPGGERTILRVKGSGSAEYGHEDFLQKMQADWLYISSLGSMELLTSVVEAAASKNIKVAFNPGTKELEHVDELKTILPKIEILMCNKDEAQKIFEGDSKEALAKKATEAVGICVVTDGPDGAAVSDGTKTILAGMYEDVKVIDRLGAGDAFCSGFTSSIANGKTLEEAITFASANSTSVVQHIGAKAGILKQGATVHDMDLKTV